MNVRLEFNAHVLAGVYWDGVVLFNDYFVRCDMITGTKNNVEQNIAMDRLKYMMFNRFQNSVFINSLEKITIKKLESAGVRTIALPEQPVDQIVGMAMFCKLDSVMEGRLHMTQLKLSSEIGDNIAYLQNEHESVGPFAEKGWWNNPEPVCSDTTSRFGKIVNINQSETWQNLDLHWIKNNDDSGNVVVAFKKDDKE